MPDRYDEQYQNISGEAFIDTSFADPTFDAREALGDDVLRKLESVSEEASVAYNGLTGEITITENTQTYSETATIEPSIPEGIDIADPTTLTRAVISPDNRRQITAPSLNSYPYCTMAYLEITYADGSRGTASGSFVGDTVILTGGHVVYSQTHGWATSVRVTPGGTLSNFSSTTTNTVGSVSGWVNNANWEYDYGVVSISRSLGTGHLGMAAKTNSQLSSINMIGNYGYPGDKASGTLWYDSGAVGTVYSRRFLHNADTYNGNSGGPVVDMSDYLNVIGVHSDAYNANYNIATRVTSSMINYVNGWIE